jgi:hypothetical protein
MSNPRRAVQASVSVTITATVHFVGFASLPAQRYGGVLSEKFACLGHEWHLEVYPGGLESADEGMVSVLLYNVSNKSINVELGFSVKDCVNIKTTQKIFHALGGGINAWGPKNFALRSKIMESLVDGALVVEVHLKLVDPTLPPPPFIPENPSACKIIQGMFMEEEYADILFEVGGQHSESNSRKDAESSSVTFPAHRLIMRKCSSTLADLCGSAGDKTTSIQIPDVSPDVFHYLLYHLYGGKVADDDMKSHAKEIIDAADKYGVVDLKLAAEACLVKTTAFSIENLMDHLLYADSKNCALLKEAAMDFMLENRGEVLKKVSFNDAPGALIRDVLAAMERGEKKGQTITELRLKAHKHGLNVDGSREMLIAALEEVSEDVSEED